MFPSVARQVPIPSKFSSANPTGSIRAWQLAHTGLVRCRSIRSRIENDCPCSVSFSGRLGTFGGGEGGGAPSRLLSTHSPRWVGDVLFGYEVTVKMLACPSSPPRVSLVRVTRRKWLP